MKKSEFKARPPKVEALQFVGDYADACDVIEQLHLMGIEASFVPDIEVFEEDQPDSQFHRVDNVKNHIIIRPERGDRVIRICAGEWIVWDPTMHNASYITPWQFNVMLDSTFKERYMHRSDEDDA